MPSFPHPLDGRPQWWLWPTILSLDAPVVALLWQEEFARVAGVLLPWYHRILLGLVVYLIYVADRWIEGLRLDPQHVRTWRHWFYMRHRVKIAVFSAAMILTGAIVAITQLQTRDWIVGGSVSTAVLIYLLSHQTLHRNSPWRAPKEMCIGILFAAGCGLSAGLQATANELAISALLPMFGFVCFTNCSLISVWEETVDREHGQSSLSLQLAQHRRIIHQLAWFGIVVGALVALTPVTHPLRESGLCIAVSSALLALIDHHQQKLGWQAAHVLADIALLTPPLAWIMPTLI